jgi:NADPH-dependent 2,4-dienoyl-CoA reductase/sulfur reductase-like enzyme
VTPELQRVVVVGASLAGLRACEALRRLGFGGELVVVDAEHRPLYDRPPLSKQFLAGSWEESRLALRSPEALASLALTTHFGDRAVRLDAAARRLELESGASLRFDGLVLACGAAARQLPSGPEPTGGDGPADVLTLRTLEDCHRLRASLTGAERRLVVVGAGFLGLEVAATASGLGAQVIVVEPLAAPLARAIAAPLGAVVASLHERHGVELCFGSGVSAVTTAGGDSLVALSDGSVLRADAVLVAIGASPETAWLAGSGLELLDGVVCDATLTAAPGVVVAGDVARVRACDGATWRVEHWTNAAEQGAHAAASLLAGARATPFRTVQYVWSDQYELKLQIIGMPHPSDEVAVVDGSLEEGRFVACCGRDGRLVAAIGFGRPRQLMAYRRFLETPTPFEEAIRRPG